MFISPHKPTQDRIKTNPTALITRQKNYEEPNCLLSTAPTGQHGGLRREGMRRRRRRRGKGGRRVEEDVGE